MSIVIFILTCLCLPLCLSPALHVHVYLSGCSSQSLRIFNLSHWRFMFISLSFWMFNSLRSLISISLDQHQRSFVLHFTSNVAAFTWFMKRFSFFFFLHRYLGSLSFSLSLSFSFSLSQSSPSSLTCLHLHPHLYLHHFPYPCICHRPTINTYSDTYVIIFLGLSLSFTVSHSLYLRLALPHLW